jgi:subtilase family serine protease
MLVSAVAALLFAVIGTLGLDLAAGVASAQPVTSSGSSVAYRVHRGNAGETDVNICSLALTPGMAGCNARIRTDAKGKTRPASPGAVTQAATIGNNGGYDPAYLQSAYNAPSATRGAGQTVAIVDAYDNPNVESDLAHYRSFFGLAPCTTANGCFRKVDQLGSTRYPVADSGWGLEIALDVDMVSAICPSCHILLVEADDNSMSSLGSAVNTAVALGANVVSNSYGGAESSSQRQSDAAYFNHPGVAITASTGDSGYRVEYPSSSPYVTAVGGTSLTQTTNTGSRNGSETAWSGAGSGCSAYEPKPVWQHDTGCANRTVADVSAVADPSTGVWIYDSYSSPGFSILGGTSAAAPIVGAMYALAGNPLPSSTTLSALPYAHSASLNDVTLGSTGSCGGSYLCTAGAGYDGPSGLGTPNTTQAFTAATAPTGPTGPTAPTAPQNLGASRVFSSQAYLSWAPPVSSGGSPVTYNIYRGTAPGSEATTPYKTGIAGTSYTDIGLTNGVPYSYKVAAVNSAGVSATSNEATVQSTGWYRWRAA